MRPDRKQQAVATARPDVLLSRLMPACRRQGGDVKLAVCIYAAGWIADRTDFDATWAGCVPESSDAGGCHPGGCQGVGSWCRAESQARGAGARPNTVALLPCLARWHPWQCASHPLHMPTFPGCRCLPRPADSFTLVWETKVLLHLNSALGKLLTMQAAGQSLQLATHSFFYAGAGGIIGWPRDWVAASATGHLALPLLRKRAGWDARHDALRLAPIKSRAHAGCRRTVPPLPLQAWWLRWGPQCCWVPPAGCSSPMLGRWPATGLSRQASRKGGRSWGGEPCGHRLRPRWTARTVIAACGILVPKMCATSSCRRGAAVHLATGPSSALCLRRQAAGAPAAERRTRRPPGAYCFVSCSTGSPALPHKSGCATRASHPAHLQARPYSWLLSTPSPRRCGWWRTAWALGLCSTACWSSAGRGHAAWCSTPCSWAAR